MIFWRKINSSHVKTRKGVLVMPTEKEANVVVFSLSVLLEKSRNGCVESEEENTQRGRGNRTEVT